MSVLRKWISSERGASAVEFALIVPIFSASVFAIFHLCALAYAMSTMHWTVEQASRCAVISRLYATAPDTGASCQTRSSTATYATSIYKGPNISPTFTATENSTCGGRRVAASATYHLNFGLVNLNLPLSAAACYPATIDASNPWT